jgi:molybdopterin-guanine dinucleotide biosynthesis protein A
VTSGVDRAAAFVLAGGRSTRMGRDKALLEVSDRPLIEIMLQKFRDLGLVPAIAGGAPELARFAPLLPDPGLGCGPLSGIASALAASQADLNLFLAIDLPLLPAPFLGWLFQRANCTGAWATVPVVSGKPQPLCAVYHRGLLPGLKEALAAGNFRVMRAVQTAAHAREGKLDIFSLESVRSAEGWRMDWLPGLLERAFLNCNTPVEARRTQQLAREGNTPGPAQSI